MNFIRDVVLPVLTAIGGVGALIFALAGFLKSSMLARQQKQFSTELEELKATLLGELEVVKLDAERLKSVHAKQFEKEFGLYEQLWKDLWTLRFHAARLGDNLDPDWAGILIDDEQAKEHRKSIDEAFSPVADICEHYAPFLHEKVHSELERFIRSCMNIRVNEEYRSLATLDDHSSTSKDIENQFLSVREAIRWRIGLTTIKWHPNFTVEADTRKTARGSPSR